MADTDTKTKTEAPQVAPPAQPVATIINRKEAWETFQADISQRADEIGTQLPPNLPRDRFIGAAIAAVKATPTILLATPRSLMSALVKAAQDGLLPDGREGIITTYNTTVREAGKPDRKEAVAQWNPMFYGIRKRAREIDGIIIDAQVVFAGDEFQYELGDAPFIKHKPKPRTEQVDASAGVAVYAIFRAADQTILHREVMWKPEVFATMNQSRAKDSLMWTVFWTEGWRKTVGRRAAKSVPVSPALERLIQRDDENYVFDAPPRIEPPRPPDPTEPPKPPEPGTILANGAVVASGEPLKSPLSTAPGGIGKNVVDPATGQLKDSTPADDVNDDDSGVSTEPTTPDDVLDNLKAWLDRATDDDTVEQTWDELDIESEFAHDVERMGKAMDLKSDAHNRINRTAAGNNGQAELALSGTPAAGEPGEGGQ